MGIERKTSQLQLRVTPTEKAAIVRAATREGVDVSSYVLKHLIPSGRDEFRKHIDQLARSPGDAYVFAAIGDFLLRLPRGEFVAALGGISVSILRDEDANYLAAMVEHAAHEKRIATPSWTASIPPLTKPMFGSELSSLRVHLLLSSPPPFRRRNIFIDTTYSGRV